MLHPSENLYRYARWDESLSREELIGRVCTADQADQAGSPGQGASDIQAVVDLLLPRQDIFSREELLNFEHLIYGVVDLETTGGPVAENRIIEIGVVIARGYEVLERWQTLVDPRAPVHPYVWKLTGLRPHQLKGAPLYADLADEVQQRLGSIPLFAHNASFDSGVLNSERRRLRQQPLDDWFCTVNWARKLLPGLPKYKLSFLADHFALCQEKAHRALDDAVATWELICIMARRCEERGHDFARLLHSVRAKRLDFKKISGTWANESDYSDVGAGSV